MNPKLELERLVRADNKNGFATLLRRHPEKFTPSELLKMVCSYRAVGCASELLNAEAGTRNDTTTTNVELEVGEGGLLSPLRVAAQKLSCGLTQLFLPRVDHDSMDAAALALIDALNSLCHNQYIIDWYRSKSLFKLLCILCLEELKEERETIRMLASKTSTAQVENICFRCIAQGETVQLTALLMAARDKLMVSTEGGLESSPIMQYIVRELGAESEKDSKDVSPFRSFRSLRYRYYSKDRKSDFRVARDVVRALWNTIDVLENFQCCEGREAYQKHEVPYAIAKQLVRKANILLDSEDVYPDDIECLRAKLSPQRQAWLNEALERQLTSGSCTSLLDSNLSQARDVCDEDLFSKESDFDSEAHSFLVSYTALDVDYKDKFVKWIVNLKSKKLISNICSVIYSNDSVNCAAAVLAGEINGFDLSLGLSGVGWTPLHESAYYRAARLTALLLEKGYSADARSNRAYLNVKQPLPLNVALEELRRNLSFYEKIFNLGPEKSAVKFLIALCQYPMRASLETVRLLAQNTKDVKKEFYNYLVNGKMVEVGALLTVAREHLLPLSFPTAGGEDFVANSIKDLFYFSLSNFVIWDRENVSEEAQGELAGTLLLLKIFDKIGDKLTAYVHFDSDTNIAELEELEVATLLRSSGFDVKEEYACYESRVYKSFEKKVLGMGHLNQPDRPLCLHKTGFQGEMHFGRRSFHTLNLSKVDSKLAPFASFKRSVDGVTNLNPCKKWTFFVAALKKGSRLV